MNMGTHETPEPVIGRARKLFQCSAGGPAVRFVSDGVPRGPVCRQVQAALDEVRSITKDDKSPVTVADFASQAIVARTS
jgi:hypothetical protein